MLRELSKLNSPSGEEDAVREYIQNKFADFTSSVDKMGNLLIDNNGNTLLVAHMDEPSLIITKVLEDGYLKFDIIGRLEPVNLISKYVTINGITGVIGIKAIHLTTEEERKSVPDVCDLFIDIGAENSVDAENFILPGDKAIIKSEYVEFGDSCIKSKALYSRIGCHLICDLLRKNLSLDGLFVVQREVNGRGGAVEFSDKEYSSAIILDCVESDNIIFGKGPAISILNSNECVTEKVKAVAEKAGINIQFDTSADTNPLVENICCKNNGIPSVLIRVPCKYLNSGSNVVDKKDIDDTILILTELLKEGI